DCKRKSRGGIMLRCVEIRGSAQMADEASLDSEFRGGCDLFDIDLELHDFLRLLAGKFRDMPALATIRATGAGRCQTSASPGTQPCTFVPGSRFVRKVSKPCPSSS